MLSARFLRLRSRALPRIFSNGQFNFAQHRAPFSVCCVSAVMRKQLTLRHSLLALNEVFNRQVHMSVSIATLYCIRLSYADDVMSNNAALLQLTANRRFYSDMRTAVLKV